MTAGTPVDMRDWGLVGPEELARVVIVSPHLDDAVLGCSSLMAARPGTTVVTVFAGRPPEYPTPMGHWDALCGFEPGDDVVAARRAEDAAALAVLDAEPVWLDHVEHAYLERADWVGADRVVDDLVGTLERLAPTAVVAPFGLGNPDHDATHGAALLARERMNRDVAWFCYEDTGYKHIPGLLAWRVSRLFRAGLWPTPQALPSASDGTAKAAALTCYASQLRALEADWALSEKLAAPAPEQCWRLDPPPAGWETLAAD